MFGCLNYTWFKITCELWNLISKPCTEVQLAVSVGQLLFTVGLPMFALSLVDLLFFLWGPCTNIWFFLFLSKVSFEGHTQNLQKNPCGFKTWMGFVWQIVIKLGTSSIWVFLVTDLLFDVILGVTYENKLVTNESAPHLTSLARVCVLWRSESSLELSALWKIIVISQDLIVTHWMARELKTIH